MKTTLCSLVTLCLGFASLSPVWAEEKPAAAPAEAPAAKKEATLKVGEFTLKADDKWAAKAQPRMMSAGGFSFLKEGKPLMDVDAYHFGTGAGGNVASNINRWQGQFVPGADGKPVPAKQTVLKYGEAKAILVEIKGTFLSGPMMGEKKPLEGQTMLGAILESKEGSVFLKMVGADADMTTAKDAFRKLIDSAYAVAGVEEKEAAK